MIRIAAYGMMFSRILW